MRAEEWIRYVKRQPLRRNHHRDTRRGRHAGVSSAPSGQRILILERGDYVPREKANWDPKVVNVDAHYNTKETWLDKDGNDLHAHTNYNVGGNTKFYGAAAVSPARA